MRKLTTKLLLGACVVVMFVGCAMVRTPVNGFVYTKLDDGLGATSNAGWSKMGTGTSTSILGIVATGDSSIETAAKSAGITKIHHVDYSAESIIGIYAKYTIKVYGD